MNLKSKWLKVEDDCCLYVTYERKVHRHDMYIQQNSEGKWVWGPVGSIISKETNLEVAMKVASKWAIQNS